MGTHRKLSIAPVAILSHTFLALQCPRAEDGSSVLCHQHHLAHWVYTPGIGKFARLLPAQLLQNTTELTFEVIKRSKSSTADAQIPTTTQSPTL